VLLEPVDDEDDDDEPLSEIWLQHLALQSSSPVHDAVRCVEEVRGVYPTMHPPSVDLLGVKNDLQVVGNWCICARR